MELITPVRALERARALTGLDDFGTENFLEGLERTLLAFANTPLTETARSDFSGRVVNDLANRLRIEDWYRTHPEIEGQRVEGPVMVCGLPRTGTTATVATLALDHRFRYLRMWEARAPVPPPDKKTEATDARRLSAIAAAKDYPDKAIHLSDPDGPEEDFVMLAGLSMRAAYLTLPTPEDFMRWWMDADISSMYAYHHRVLKLLQSHRPPNLWLLKAPMHTFHLEALAAEYPTMKFVWTHRDPVKVLGSVASLLHRHYSRSCVESALDKHWTGKRCLWIWREGARRALQARDRIGESRFVDVYNEDVVKDPLATFTSLYEQLGLSIDAELRGRWQRYHSERGRGAFGQHVYDIAEFGLDESTIRSAFEPYVERFDL